MTARPSSAESTAARSPKGPIDPGPGLDHDEAASRLRRDGPNLLPRPPRRPAWRALLAQLTHFFALMLWVAGALAFVAGMPQLGVAIFVVILVNGAFAFAQEQRAERAAEKLRELLPRSVTVRRSGERTTVDASELVVGDRVLLSAGDRIAADLVVAEAHELIVDASTLTGESVGVPATVDEPMWAGTFLVGGEGEAEVTAVGRSTRLAGIATLAASVERPTSPLSLELRRIVRVMAAITIGVGIAFFGVSLAVGTPASDGFLFAVGVTVALVPEGLLPTVTLSLAVGAQRMARDDALVRHLEAVETLGSTTFICTDKTGTLTRNEMTVVAAWTPAGSLTVRGDGYGPTATVSGDDEALRGAVPLARAAALCSQGDVVLRDDRWVPVGDPMEAAIVAFERRVAPAEDEHPADIEDRFPFDPVRRRASVQSQGWLLTKGAPDSVLPRCTGDMPLAEGAVDDLASRGLRVLAVARRPIAQIGADWTADEAECELELLGVVALQDPPRDGVTEALADCRLAGINVAMVTGDHPTTARAVARQLGLVSGEERVLLGSDLPHEEERLGELVDHDGVVVSRVTPEDKMRIAKALQRRGHVVAMTGDGVNDGPALKQADIGVAMGRSGTDVAREAADLVLLDDHFATIVVAVRQGRATFANVRRFLTYHLTDNVAELTPFVIWALSGGHFPLALGVLQVLCLDIATDLLPALALGAEAPRSGDLGRRVAGRHVLDGSLVRRVFGVLGPTEAAVEMTAFVIVLALAGWRPGGAMPASETLMAASGAAFAAVVLGQAANAFACRSASVPPWRLGWTSNRFLVGAVAVQVVLLVGLLWIGPVARLLGQAPPPWQGALAAAAAVPAVLAVDATHKWLRRRRSGPEPSGAPVADHR